MQVPRTPNGRAVARTEGRQQAVRPLDFSPIFNTIRGFANHLEDERKKAEEFDLQRRLIDETNELTQDFARRQQEAPLGAAGFTDSVLGDYETRHNAILNEYAARGFDMDALEPFAVRLASVRQQFGERALAFQSTSLKAQVGTEFNQLAQGLSQYAATTPDGYAAARDELRMAVDRLPGFSAPEKEQAFDQQLSVIRQGAAKGLVQQNPGLVIQLLDPRGLTAPPKTSVTGGAYDVVEGFDMQSYLQRNRSAESGGNDAAQAMTSSAYGRYQFLKDTWVEQYQKTFGETGESREQILAKRADGATQDRVMETFTAQNTAALQEAGLTVNAASAYLAHFLGVGDAIKVLQADENMPVSEIVSSASVRANRSILGNRNVRELVLWAVDKMGSEPLTASEPATITTEQKETPDGADGIADPLDLANVQTGSALLDDLSGEERLQVLAWARQEADRAMASQKAAFDVVVQNAQASIALGEYGGPRPSKDQFLQVYGTLEGEQRYAQFETALTTGQVVQRIKTQSPAQMQRELEMLRPDPASPTYAVEASRYQAAQQAVNTIMAQRKDDPAAYAISAFPQVAEALANAENSEQRKAAFAQLERAYESLGVPVAERYAGSKQMIEALGDRYDAQGAPGKLAMIEEALAEMGSMAGRTLGQAGGRQLAQDLATYAMVRTSPNYRATFMDILRGKAVIAQDPARKPSTQAINTTFAGSLNTAINNLSPEQSRGINEAAAALYVQRGGRSEGNILSDPELYSAALREAVGGSAANANTGIVDMTDGRVTDMTILPPGVTKQRFENWIDSLAPGDLTKRSVNGRSPHDNRNRPLALQDIVDEGTFVMVAPGIYGIKLQSDGGWVGDGAGGRFLVNLGNLR